MNEVLIKPEAGDYGQPRLVVPAPSDPRYAHLGWPKIATAPDGTLVLAYLSGTTHITNGCPVVAVSKDGGHSFSEPRILIELHEGLEFEHSGNLALGFAADGAIVLLAMALRGERKGSTIFGWRSTDSGETWTSVNTDRLRETAGSVYGHVFAVPGRGLAVTGHYREGTAGPGEGLWIGFSEDDGFTWGEPQLITEQYLGEPAFCYAGGKLIGLAKGRKSSSVGYTQFESTDGGRQWKVTPAVLSTERNPASPVIIPDPDDPNVVYAFQTERVITGAEEAPGHITLFRANADDLAWEKVGVVAYFSQMPAVRRDFGYPWMAKRADGTWFLVFYDGVFAGANSIWGLTLEIGERSDENDSAHG